MGIYQSKTASLYNNGLEFAEAVSRGADPILFQQFEEEFSGGSIPCHLLHGFKYTPPYSCDYHTGGTMSQQLREIVGEWK